MQRTTLALLALAVSATAQDFVFPLGFANAGGPPANKGPAHLTTNPGGGPASGGATTLVRADGTRNNNYYPSYSPDDAWVLFNRAAGNSNHNLDAQLWVVPAGGGSPTHLARADLADSMGNSWPKWAPFVQRFHGEPLMWFTFSSRRDYGLRLRQQSREPAMRTTQLWMAGLGRSWISRSWPSMSASWRRGARWQAIGRAEVNR